jgi:hypothetical protein
VGNFMKIIKSIIQLSIGAGFGVGMVLSCSDGSPHRSDAAACDCPAAEVKAELARRIAPLEAELAKLRQDIGARIRDRADGQIAARMLKRNESVELSAHERNDDHVLVQNVGRLAVATVQRRSRNIEREKGT